MKRFIEENDRTQGYLLPESMEEYVTCDNPVRVIDAFVEERDLGQLGFAVQLVAAGLPPLVPTQDLYLRVPEPDPVEPTPGAGGAAQPGVDVVDRAPDAGV